MTTTTSIRYATELGKYRLFRRHCHPHGQGQDGYGMKITTSIMLQFEDEKRPRRVYCTCFSNAGSCWILRKGEKFYVDAYQSEVEDE
jgi:hypothetical protein